MSTVTDHDMPPLAGNEDAVHSPRTDLERDRSTTLAQTLLYLVLGLPLGLLYLTVILTGMSLSIGLMPLALLGIPVTIGLSHIGRALMRFERRLANSLLGAQIDALPPVPRPDGGLWRRFKSVVADRYGWRGMLFLLLRFPAGIVTFTTSVVFAALSVGLTFAPAYMWAGDNRDWLGRWFDSYLWSFALVPIGLLVSNVTVRLVRVLGTACRRWTISALNPPCPRTEPFDM